jgi:adenine-specific DNA-methyltransferase
MGTESSNLYTGFLATAIQLLDPQGELVAITPRSFCNGPYFQPFRKKLLETMSLRHLHVFDSRSKAFRDDAVLQENVILHAIKSPQKPAIVTITSTHGPDDELALVHDVAYAQVVHPDDPRLFLHIVQDHASQLIAQTMARFHTSLTELGIQVSTGRVVDFRVSDLLRAEMEADTVPLLLPTHVTPGSISWPKLATKKPNALLDTQRSKTLQVPNGYYVLVKRFTAKEEKKRLVAAVYDPTTMPGLSVGFENHLNYFHQEGQGLDQGIARGLAAYLNSTLADAYFRQFNGHTQVNATDLRTLTYPSRAQLEALGRRIPSPFPGQNALDQMLKEELFDWQSTENPAGQEHDPVQAKRQIEKALRALKDLGFARKQQHERVALTLLALLNLKPHTLWSHAESPLVGISPMMVFLREQYGKNYAPVPQTTGRLQIIQQFLDLGLILAYAHTSVSPLINEQTLYQIEQRALELLQTFETPGWAKNISAYLAARQATKP